MRVRRGIGGAIVASLAMAGGCNDEVVSSGGTPVVLRFAAKVGDVPFACGTTFSVAGVGPVTPLDWRMFVHDVRLVDTGGHEFPVTLDQDGVWQTDNVALLDFEDKTGTCTSGTTGTHLVVSGTVDAELAGNEATTFNEVRFKLGVPSALNHADPATAKPPLDLTGLFWGWQAGHKFLRIDMLVPDTGATGATGDADAIATRPFSVHLGSTGCTLDNATHTVKKCAGPNRPEIALPGFDLTGSTIVLDFAALVAGVDLAADDAGGALGCQGDKDDPECAVVMPHLGLELATGLAAAGQTAFHLE